MILTSDFSTGLTELRLKVFLNEDKGIVQFGAKTIEINKVGKPLVVSVYLNGYKNEYTIDLKQGKYIGLSKKSNMFLDFYQAKEPFEYD
jgi:hypothetical protein